MLQRSLPSLGTHIDSALYLGYTLRVHFSSILLHETVLSNICAIFFSCHFRTVGSPKGFASPSRMHFSRVPATVSDTRFFPCSLQQSGIRYLWWCRSYPTATCNCVGGREKSSGAGLVQNKRTAFFVKNVSNSRRDAVTARCRANKSTMLLMQYASRMAFAVDTRSPSCIPFCMC